MTPLVFTVKEVKKEAPNVKTYIFDHKINAKPGQFVMVWLPGIDEVPMSIGWQDENGFELTIADAGDCTHAIHTDVEEGTKLGIRGPYGNPFSFKEKRKIILVGGGCGTPPMLSLAQMATGAGLNVTVLLGGRTKEHLLYHDRFKKLGCKIHTATDDGSAGHKGFVTDLFEKELEKSKFDCAYTCGPEIMMYKVAQLAQDYNMESQVSLERFMKCGFGICGQCCIDDSGLRVCKDGPVFDGITALKHPEFGKYKRSASGETEDFSGCKIV